MTTYAQERDKYIVLAEQAKDAADRRTKQMTRNAQRSLEQRYPKFRDLLLHEQDAQIRDVMLEARKTDVVWKGHVADNQWYMQQAMMYGTAMNGELLQRLVDALPPHTQIFSSYVK